MMNAEFSELFALLTGNSPFPWQEELARRFLAKDIPIGCDLPTGMGKTSVISIWVICLGLQAMTDQTILPRRLIYTVNRRVIVDQATEEVHRILEALANDCEPKLMKLREALFSLAATRNTNPIAVSTLRGGLADNQEWKVDPTRPSIVIGTVDMIGSKLFFSGYGDGRRDRPLHAAFLAQDSLFIHDESHLMPAFARSLRDAHALNRKGAPWFPFHAIDLSATLTKDMNKGLFSLTSADYAHPVIRQRLGLGTEGGKKRLRLHLVSRNNEPEAIKTLALEHESTGTSVLIYVRTVAQVRKVQEALLKSLKEDSEDRVLVLTGTLRGYERDQLTSQQGFQRFLPARDRNHANADTVYLISTAAGEVGANFDADHCVCDLSTLESMIQRFGRVNRFGLSTESVIDVVTVKEELEKKRKRKKDNSWPLSRTLEALTSLDGDASVGNLSRLTEYKDAYTPPPIILDLDAWTMDAWSVTGLQAKDFPQRPDVALWLHGITEHEPPDTHIAWRFDLDLFRDVQGPEAAALSEDYLDLLPLHTRELLRAPTRDVRGALADMHEYWATIGRDFVGILITAEGEVVLDTVEGLIEHHPLEWGTVILPSKIGGLSQTGLLDTSQRCLKTTVTDVADEPGKRERFVIHRQGNTWFWRQGNENTGSVVANSLREASRTITKERGYRVSKILEFKLTDMEADADEFGRAVVVLINPELSLPAAGDLSAYSKEAQKLDDHLNGAEEAARRITAKLNLPASIAEAVCLAALWHDKGKNRPYWQKAIGNFTEEPLAKSGHTHFERRFTRGYRHEFGSLLDAEEDQLIQNHPERDLILHLIAAHHGYARPCFVEQAFDRTFPYERNTQAQEAALERFALLQTRFGWWQLAWLEALVKSADALGAPND